MNKIFFLVAVLLVHCSGLHAQSLPLDPAVRTGKLPNGFTYFIRHNETPKNRVIFYLANKVGSVLEDENERGLAHFMEHMNFNGTIHFPKDALVDYLQKAGVRFGADINAYTNFDETVYQLPLPSDKPELLQNGIQIMRDWAHGATLDPTEIDKERGVVLEEKRLGKGASERMRQVYYPFILNHSRYADRLPIGVDAVVINFKPATIQRFYKDWYRPDLQSLIVVGDINVNEMEKTIKAKFSNLKNPVKEKPRYIFKASLSGKNQFLAVTDKETTSTSIDIIIKHPEQKLITANDYRNRIIRSLFNQMLAARYADLTRQADPPYISGGASIGAFLAGLDVYSATLTAKPGELERGLKAIWRETIRANRFGFTETELDRAKKNYLKQVEVSFKEKDKYASRNFVNQYLQYFLKGTAAPSITEEYKLVQSDLRVISLTDVNALSKEYIRSVDRDILLTAPDKEKINLPDQQTVENWLAQVETEKLLAYKDEINSLPFLLHEPISGKTLKEKVDKKLNTTILTLNNGVKVLLKPTDFQNDQIIFSAFASGGTSLYDDTDYQSGSNAVSVISLCGLGNYNTSELDKYLADKQVGVNVNISEQYETVSGFATTKDLETALQLVYARFTEPRKDKAAFDGFLSRSKASLSNRSNDPKSVFSDTINAFMGQGNIRRTGPSIAKLDQINLDRAFEIYKERFADASNFTFVFVGSFTVESIRPLLEKYLGGLPANYRGENYKDLGINIPEGRLEKTVYKGTESKATVNLVFSGMFDYRPSEIQKLDALKEVLEIRLLKRLREDESGVYSPTVSESVVKYPQAKYNFTISFGCGPQNVKKMISSALDEVNELRTVGPPQINVDKYKAEDQRTLETALKTNNWWLSYLTINLQNQDDLHGLDEYDANLLKVSPESLKTMANKYLSGRNYIQLILLPEK